MNPTQPHPFDPGTARQLELIVEAHQVRLAQIARDLRRYSAAFPSHLLARPASLRAARWEERPWARPT